MPSRPFSFTPKPSATSFFTKTSVLFIAFTISASVVIFCSILYFLYHIWNSLVHRAKTIPFDASAPLKLQRFSYKDLKQATNGFDTANVIGKGGSGTVFRGILKDGKLIAIKRLDSLSLQSEREFQNELQTLGGLRSPFLVTLLGYSVEKSKRVLVYEYMPNRSLQESLFGEGCVSLSWERRFCIILDVARALEFLHLGCDPPVIHGDIKPSNVLLDAECRGKISDFGLSRIKVEGEFGMDLFSQDLGKSQDLSGNLTAETQTPPVIGTPVESVNEVDFALALQASSSSKNSRTCFNVRALNLNSMDYNANIIASESEIKSVNNNAKGKEISTLDIGGDDCWNSKFVPYDDEFSSIDYSKELSPNTCLVDDEKENGKQWGKDWWWRQDGSGELCSKDYVKEWIGSQICESKPSWDYGKNNIHEKVVELESSDPTIDKANDANGAQPDNVVEKKELKGKKNQKKKQRKMQEWWKEEHVAELSKKGRKLKTFQSKWRKGLKVPHFDLGRRFYISKRKKNFGGEKVHENECDQNGGEFSFRRGWRKKSAHSVGMNPRTKVNLDMIQQDKFARPNSKQSREIRKLVCSFVCEKGTCKAKIIENSDIYYLGMLQYIIVKGRQMNHIIVYPQRLEKGWLGSTVKSLADVSYSFLLGLVDRKLSLIEVKEGLTIMINLTHTTIQVLSELELFIVMWLWLQTLSILGEFGNQNPVTIYWKSRTRSQSHIHG
ncbi:unnamed protein product [Lupinus luteus]|uniref:non-specific serine/threonine protein kinase n=1 Tax=Lupinus luteus TaxID=3873 RepID=A0AAV1YEY2_LUPLU